MLLQHLSRVLPEVRALLQRLAQVPTSVQTLVTLTWANHGKGPEKQGTKKW